MATLVTIALPCKPRATFTEAFGDMALPGRAWLLVAVLALALGGAAAFLNANAIMQRASTLNPVEIGAPAGASGELVIGTSPAQQDIGGQPGAMGGEATPLASGGAVIGAAASTTAGWLVWAIGLLIGGTLLGGRSTFRNVFKMTVLASLPLIMRSLIQIIALALGAPPIINPGFGGFVSAEPGAFNTFARSLLGSVDAFQLWNLALLAIGVSVVARMTARKALILVSVIGLLIVVFSALPTILLSGFSTSP
jgi:Yip1 domain